MNLDKNHGMELRFAGDEAKSTKQRPVISFESINAKVNSITPGELFWQYAKCGFLYPKKKRKLTPYIELVEENWRKALQLGEEIFWIGSVFDYESKSWASVCNWRTTMGGWVSQHLVSSGNAAYPLMLMLGTAVKVIKEKASKPYNSFQNWYRPTNRYANKVFGHLAATLNINDVGLQEYQYFMVDSKSIPEFSDSDVRLLKCDNKNPHGISKYLKQNRSDIFMESEELLKDDIELLELNEIYKKVGLERKRSFWLAFNSTAETPCGAIIVYRAPLGLNFSMLENRCEVIVDSDLKNEEALKVCCALINRVKEDYADFVPSFIPLISNVHVAGLLAQIDIKTVRSYNQFLWTKEAFQDWYNALWDMSEHSIDRWLRVHKRSGEI